MSTFITILMAVSLSLSSVEGYTTHISQYDQELISLAKNTCENARKDLVDEVFLSRLLEIEKTLGVPFEYRGMVLAAACNESGYNRLAVGDGGKAVGILQMWPWWKSRFGVDRRDPYAAANAWVSQILRTVPKAVKRCGKRRGFLAAWSWVAAGPKGWRCRAPRHYTRLRHWYRDIKLRKENL